MATLEKIRNKAGLLVVVVGVALFAFIIGDFLRSGSTFFQQSKEKVAVVDGESISIQDYQARVEEMSTMYKNSGNASLSEEMQNQIRQSVFDEMVGKILLDEESDKVGFAVGKTELTDLLMGDNISPMIQQIPDFQNPQTGMFDKNSLIQFLQMIESDDMSMYPDEMRMQIENAKNFWLYVERSVIQQQLQTKFSTLLATTLVSNDLDAKAAYDNNKISVDFDYVSQSYSTVPDDEVSVSDSEISKVYNERKDLYKQEEGRVIDFIAVNILPAQQDFEEVQKQLEKVRTEFGSSTHVADIVNENSDVPYLDAFQSSSLIANNLRNFAENSQIGTVEGPIMENGVFSMNKLVAETVAPDSVMVNHLMLPSFTADSVLVALSDSLTKVVKDGKPFSEMALEATGGQSNGSLGWQTETSILQSINDFNFKDAVFNATLNDLKVVKSTFGSHLIQVVEKTKPVKKYKVATIHVAVTPSTETYNKLYNDLNQYISKNNNLEAFKSAASEAGYTIQNNVTVTKNQLSLAAIKNSRQVIRWAFENKKGSLSDIFECDDFFVVSAMEDVVKEGIRPLNSVSSTIKGELMNKKKADKIIADLKAKNLSTLGQYAQAMNKPAPDSVVYVSFNTPRISGIGAEPVLNAEAPIAEVGQVAGPFAGNNAVYVISVKDKRASEGDFEAASQKQNMNMQNSFRIYQAVQNAQVLRENAKVEDNRIRFY